MKKLINGVLGAFLVMAVGSAPLHGMDAPKGTLGAPAKYVVKGNPLLNQIMDRAWEIVWVYTSISHHKVAAGLKLASLMESKQLSAEIKNAIKDDVNIILKSVANPQEGFSVPDMVAAEKAYSRLVVIVQQIEAQENVITAIKEGTELVKNAPIDEKQDAIKAAQEKIQEAEAEQGILSHLYSGAKRIITAPANYIFGEESSKAKTAFYTTVGAAVLSAGAYALSPSADMPKKIIEEALLPEKNDNKNDIKVVEQDTIIGDEINEIKEPVTSPVESLSPEKSIEAEQNKQKQLENVINYSTVERFAKDLETQRSLEFKKHWLTTTDEQKQELEDATKNVEAFRSQIEGLKQNGISEREIQQALEGQAEALEAAEKEKKDRTMVDLAEMQRKYLKSVDPEDRERLYSYEQDIKEKKGLSWEEIYESRNKIRQEEGIGNDSELTILAEIQRKYLKYLKEDDEEIAAEMRDKLYKIVSHMFDTLSVKEINALHRRVIKEIKEGIHFQNITDQLVSNESDVEFNNFIQEFAPPLNIQETIEAHKDEDVSYGLLRGKNEYSNVFAKGNDFGRLFNADRMRECIERNNFTTLAVPKKWIYKVDGQWRVYAEYIGSGEGKTLTLKETQDLVGLAEQTGYRDWIDNIIINQRNGKITIIDTEDYSFALGRYRLADFPQNCKLQYAYSLYAYYNAMDDDAREWFENRINYLKNSEEGTTKNEPLPWSGQFNSSNFDFDKIKTKLEQEAGDTEIQY